MFRKFSQTKILATVVGAISLVAMPALGGYLPNGYDLGLVKSESGLVNAAASVQANGLWGSYTKGTEKTTSFTIPSCQTVNYARLYLDVYGATPYYSGQVTATLNGTALPTLTIGGTGAPSPGMPGDGNPANRDPNTTCVYGSGYAFWQIAYAGIAPLLKTDGTANTLAFTITDPTGSGFDGRQYGATLAAVYTDPSIQQALDYQLFEGDVYLRSTAGSTPPNPAIKLTSSLSITGVNTSDVTSATYTAGYATGHNGKSDQVFFNGTSLGQAAGLGNDVARFDSNVELRGFDVAGSLLATNDVSYSIDTSVLGGAADTPLHLTTGMLTVTHSVPEPASLCLVGLGGLLLMRRRPRV
jgi:hypothetical protein